VRLGLETVDLWSHHGAVTRFDEESLLAIFEQVCEIAEPGAETSRMHAVQRRRDQRLLSSVDGAGLVRAGEYAVTSLASANCRLLHARRGADAREPDAADQDPAHQPGGVGGKGSQSH